MDRSDDQRAHLVRHHTKRELFLMGYYINPKNGTKEQWLAEHGTPITPAVAKAHVTGDKVVVCLVDNGAFTAAGIGYDDTERNAFAQPDSRPKLWYLVERGRLVQEGFLRA
jgi:hypothetical protein